MSVLDQLLADLAGEGDRLRDLVAGLDDAGWHAPTPAAGWDVATQVAHLAWTDEMALQAARAAAGDTEGWDAAVLEAMAAGCAVVSTTCQGNDEVLVDGENSRTFAVGDVAGAVVAVRQLLSDPLQRERLGDVARRVAQDYSVSTMVEQYRVLYNRSSHVPDSLRLPSAGRPRSPL